MLLVQEANYCVFSGNVSADSSLKAAVELMLLPGINLSV